MKIETFKQWKARRKKQWQKQKGICAFCGKPVKLIGSAFSISEKIIHSFLCEKLS